VITNLPAARASYSRPSYT